MQQSLRYSVESLRVLYSTMDVVSYQHV